MVYCQLTSVCSNLSPLQKVLPAAVGELLEFVFSPLGLEGTALQQMLITNPLVFVTPFFLYSQSSIFDCFDMP